MDDQETRDAPGGMIDLGATEIEVSEEQSLGDGERFVLRLYIAGSTPRARSAIRDVRKMCDEYIEGDVDLEVYDLHQQPWKARDAEIIAAPTLVKELPPPLRRIIGSLSDIEHVLVKLGISQRSTGDRRNE